MSDVREDSGSMFIARGDKIEVVPVMNFGLLCQGSDTNGAMSALRHGLQPGGTGALPHYHEGYAEMLYILEGKLAVLGGESVIELREGDMAVVPKGMIHAFAAKPDQNAEYILITSPGIDRFEYFRSLAKLRAEGLSSPKSLQERFDNHNVDSETWNSFLHGIAEAAQ
jgi:quercetin dioxygenase-like cupin family protein